MLSINCIHKIQISERIKQTKLNVLSVNQLNIFFV